MLLRSSNQNLQQKNDVFDEILPIINAQPQANVKILFPCNLYQSHWGLAEIQLIKKIEENKDPRYIINLYFHDPLGKGKFEETHFVQLSESIKARLKNNVEIYNNLTISNAESPYSVARQTDGSSCGPITIEQLVNRIKGKTLDREPYSSGAIELRKRLFVLLRQRQLANQGMLKTTEQKSFFELHAKKFIESKQNIVLNNVIKSAQSLGNEEKLSEKTDDKKAFLKDNKVLNTTKKITLPPISSLDQIAQAIDKINATYQIKLDTFKKEEQVAKKKYEEVMQKINHFNPEAMAKAEIESLKPQQKSLLTNIINIKKNRQMIDERLAIIQDMANQILERKNKELKELAYEEETIDENVEQLVSGKYKNKLEKIKNEKSERQKTAYKQLTFETELKNQADRQSRLEKVIAEQRLEIEATQAKLASHQQQLKKFELNKDGIAKALDKLINTDKKKCETNYSNVENAITEHENKVAQAKQNYAHIRLDLEERLNNAQSHLQNLLAAHTQKTTEHRDLGNQALRLSQHGQTLSNQWNALHHEWQVLNTPLSGDELGRQAIVRAGHNVFMFGHFVLVVANERVNAANAKCNECNNKSQEIANNNNAISQKNAEQSHKWNEINHTNRLIHEARLTIGTLQTKITQHTASWGAQENQFEQEIKNLRAQREEASTRLIDCQTKITTTQKEREHVQELIKTERSEIQITENILHEKTNIFNLYQDNLVRLQQKIKELQQELQQRSSNLNKAQSANQTNINQTQSKAIEEAAKKQVDKDDATLKELDRLKKEKSSLESQLIQLQTEYDTAKLRIAELANCDEKANPQVSNAYFEKLSDNKLNCLATYQACVDKRINIETTYQDAIQIYFLSQAKALIGFNSKNISIINSLIGCLLQAVFKNYPIYRIGDDANAITPSLWEKQINIIKEKAKLINLKENAQLSTEVIATIIDTINLEYAKDGIALDVKMLGKKLLINSAYLTATTDKKIRQITLWQNGQNDFVLLMPDDDCINPNPFTHSYRLFTELLAPKGLTESLCAHTIERDLKAVLKEASLHQLADYFKEQEEKIMLCNDFDSLNQVLLN